MIILTVAPHYDDEILGCGGTLLAHAHLSHELHIVWCTDGGSDGEARHRESEAATRGLELASTNHLGFPELSLSAEAPSLSRRLVDVILRTRPERILCPHIEDGHPDHKATATAIQLAIRMAACAPDGWSVKELWGYEIWTPLQRVSKLVDISEQFDRKTELLACFFSQFRSRRIDLACLSLNQYRGLLSGARAAEAFARIDLDGPQPLASVI